jgi:hypothetical protein
MVKAPQESATNPSFEINSTGHMHPTAELHKHISFQFDTTTHYTKGCSSTTSDHGNQHWIPSTLEGEQYTYTPEFLRKLICYQIMCV